MKRNSAPAWVQKLTALGPALTDRNFRCLFFGRVISSVGDRVTPIALSFAILEQTKSASTLGLVLSSRSLAMIIFLLVGGVWSDRLNRQRVLIGTDLLRLLTQGLTAALLLTGQAEVVPLVLLQFLNGAGQAFFRPAATGIAPAVVQREHLLQANAMLHMAETVTTIFGAAFAGILMATIGPGWAIAFDALTFGLSAMVLAQMRLLPGGAAASSRHFWTELTTGWQEFRSRRWLLLMVGQFALYHLAVFAPFFVLGPMVAERSLGGASAWATVMTVYGIGTVVGGGFGLRLRPRNTVVLVSLLFLPQVLPLVALAVGGNLAVLAGAALLAGAAGGYSGALWDTTLQERVPPEAISRVSSYDWLGSMVFLPLGYAVVGPLHDLLGMAAVLWIAVGLQTTMVMAGLPALRRPEAASA